MQKQPLNLEVQKQVFTEARSFSNWVPEPVSDNLLKQVYDLMKFGPTAANSCPARIIFVKSSEAKEKLITVLDKGNIEKVRTSPVTVIIAQDMQFYEKLTKLFPHTDAKSWYVGNEKLIEQTAFRNSTLQGAYFMLAARTLGLDCGPMSGFNNAKLDELFFSGTSWKSNFICALGYGENSKLFPRGPRLDFTDACKIL